VYRKAVRDSLGESHPAFKYLRLSNEDMEEYREDYRGKIAEDHINLRPIDDEALVGIAVDIAKRAETVDPLELAGALLLLTGRRTVEALKTATFSPSPKRHSVFFCGSSESLVAPEWTQTAEIASIGHARSASV
jgi:hypothetical protein